jgi:hypothetical protein
MDPSETEQVIHQHLKNGPRQPLFPRNALPPLWGFPPWLYGELGRTLIYVEPMPERAELLFFYDPESERSSSDPSE